MAQGVTILTDMVCLLLLVLLQREVPLTIKLIMHGLVDSFCDACQPLDEANGRTLSIGTEGGNLVRCGRGRQLVPLGGLLLGW